MNDLINNVVRRLLEDGLVVALLPAYMGKPNIFQGEHVPGNAELPWVVVPARSSFGAFVTDPLAGDREIVDILVYDEITNDPAIIDLLAEVISTLFNWSVLTTTYFTNLLASATGGVEGGHAEVQARHIRVNFFESTVTSGTISFEDYEIPVEATDGIVTNFSTTRVYVSGSLQVWLNGYEQKPGTDFSQDADRNGWTMVTGAPASGAEIWCKYRY